MRGVRCERGVARRYSPPAAEEDDRSGMSSNVNDRPAKELYYQAFQGSVDAGVGSAMCS